MRPSIRPTALRRSSPASARVTSKIETSGSPKTFVALSNETWCLARLRSAFASSHSKAIGISDNTGRPYKGNGQLREDDFRVLLDATSVPVWPTIIPTVTRRQGYGFRPSSLFEIQKQMLGEVQDLCYRQHPARSGSHSRPGTSLRAQAEGPAKQKRNF